MCSIKITYKTSFSQHQGNKTLLTASQQTAHAQSVTFSLLRNSNLHKNLNRALQLILLCFYCTMSPCNETPECHWPEDIFCARSKALCGIQPRCSGASTVSGTAIPVQGSPTLMFPCEDTDLTGRSSWHGTKQMQLAAMLSVNSGVTDFGIPWMSPMAIPRKLKAMMISRIWERQQCLQSSDFDGTD